MNAVLSVRELTAALRQQLESSFPFVWVKGEVSNLSRPSSGHIYFSLKDSDALLNCVWFKNRQRGEERFDPLTGEVFEDGPRLCLSASMANGQQIMCAGRVTVYPPRGSYQLVVELAQDVGQGALHAALAALRQKLMDLGYFAQERKRPLPVDPQRVAVITAPTGAAIHDFLRLAGQRGSGGAIRIFPVPVQGAAAAPAIVRALALVAQQGWAQVVVLIRGGGSLEDLWAFNEEAVAQAVFASPLPVLAGIGHEVDVSMADMTADLRAATPTHAAQLLWPSRQDLVQRVDAEEEALQAALQDRLQGWQELLHRREQALGWLSPARALARRQESFDHLLTRLTRCGLALPEVFERRAALLWQALPRAMSVYAQKLQAQLEENSLRLAATDPLAPLDRGYAMVRTRQGKVLRSVSEASLGQSVDISLKDGVLQTTIARIQNDQPRPDTAVFSATKDEE